MLTPASSTETFDAVTVMAVPAAAPPFPMLTKYSPGHTATVSPARDKTIPLVGIRTHASGARCGNDNLPAVDAVKRATKRAVSTGASNAMVLVFANQTYERVHCL